METLNENVFPNGIPLPNSNLYQPNLSERAPKQNIYTKNQNLIRDFITTTGIVTDIIEQYDEWLYTKLATQLSQIPIILPDFRKIIFASDLTADGLTYPKLEFIGPSISPLMAIDKKLPYVTEVWGNIIMLYPLVIDNQYVRDVNNNLVYNTMQYERVRVHLLSVPTMVRSKHCYLFNKTDEERMLLGTCSSDIGGYFIISGQRYVVVGQELIIQNKPIVTIDPTDGKNILKYVSKTPTTSEMFYIKNVENKIQIHLGFFNNGSPEMKKYHWVNIFLIYDLLLAAGGLERWPIDNIISYILTFFEPRYHDKVRNILSNTELDYMSNAGDMIEIITTIMISEKEKASKAATNKIKESTKPSGKAIDWTKQLAQKYEEFKTLPYTDRRIKILGLVNNAMFPQITAEMQVLPNTDQMSLNVNTILQKINMYTQIVVYYLERIANIRPLDDRDSWYNKKINSAAGCLEKVVFATWRESVNSMSQTLTKSDTNTANKSNLTRILSYVGVRDVVNNMVKHLTHVIWASNAWRSPNGKKKENVVQLMKSDNPVAILGHLNEVMAPINDQTKSDSVRDVKESQILLIDPNITPESKKLGLVKYRTILTKFSNFIDPILIIKILNNMNNFYYQARLNNDVEAFQNNPDICEIISFKEQDKPDLIDAIIVEGIFVGFSNGAKLYKYFRENIRNDTTMKYLGLYFDAKHHKLVISTEMGRPMAPLLIVNSISHRLVIDEKGLWGRHPNELIREGALEFMDSLELSTKRIAHRPQDLINKLDMIEAAQQQIAEYQVELEGLNASLTSYDLSIDLGIDGKPLKNPAIEAVQERINEIELQMVKINQNIDKLGVYTHCMLHQIQIFSFASSLIPLANYNQGPRITYGANHLAQAMGILDSVFFNLQSTSRVLNLPQRPLVSTMTYDLAGLSKLAAGQNVIIAIMTWGGYNMEDGYIVDRGYLEYGGFLYSVYKTVVVETINPNSSMSEKIAYPIPNKNKDPSVYANLDADGIVKLNSRVRVGDCVVGKQVTRVVNGKVETVDTSYYTHVNEEGIVDEVIRDFKPGVGVGRVQIRLRNTKTLQVGDKLADRHAQKGTVATIVNIEDMPYFEDGSRPALLMSPWAIPSRMTMGKLWETILAIYGLLSHEDVDASAFEPIDYDKIIGLLSYYGSSSKGTRTMYNPHTGKAFEVEIFSGPNYYQLLKHLVDLKKQGQTKTSYDALTKQPVHGRNREGGVRLGEMDRDAFMSHNALDALLALMGVQSDAIPQVICSTCGAYAIKGLNGEAFMCHRCGNTIKNNFKSIDASAAFDLIRKSAFGLGINMQLKVQK